MIELATGTMSTKGQVVIPLDLREGFDAGRKLVFLRKDNGILVKRADKVAKKLLEDAIVSQRVREAYKRYDEGKFVEMDSKDFLERIKKW